MAAQDIEYVELYASDVLAAIDYFVSSFGFTWMAECVADGRRSSLLRHGTVQLVVTSGRGTEEFIEAHGDGIADIAFGCDDPLRRTCERPWRPARSLINLVTRQAGGLRTLRRPAPHARHSFGRRCLPGDRDLEVAVSGAACRGGSGCSTTLPSSSGAGR